MAAYAGDYGSSSVSDQFPSAIDRADLVKVLDSMLPQIMDNLEKYLQEKARRELISTVETREEELLKMKKFLKEIEE